MSSHALAHCCVQHSCIELVADTNSHSTSTEASQVQQHVTPLSLGHSIKVTAFLALTQRAVKVAAPAYSGHSLLPTPSLSTGKQRSKQAFFLGVAQKICSFSPSWTNQKCLQGNCDLRSCGFTLPSQQWHPQRYTCTSPAGIISRLTLT